MSSLSKKKKNQQQTPDLKCVQDNPCESVCIYVCVSSVVSGSLELCPCWSLRATIVRPACDHHHTSKPLLPAGTLPISKYTPTLYSLPARPVTKRHRRLTSLHLKNQEKNRMEKTQAYLGVWLGEAEDRVKSTGLPFLQTQPHRADFNEMNECDLFHGAPSCTYR